MKYRGHDIDVRSGDIILFRSALLWYKPLTWLAAAIRLFTSVRYNHVAIVVSSWDVLMINEARETGVVARPLEQYLERKKNYIRILRLKGGIDEGAICRRANSKLGAAYDFRSLLWDQLRYRLFKVWHGLTGDAAANAFVCSEYVAWCYAIPQWWVYSAKELMESGSFETVYEEQK